MSIAPDVIARIMDLPSPERAELAHQLLLSLESDDFDADADVLWEAELEARALRRDNGQARVTDWREAMARLREKLA